MIFMNDFKRLWGDRGKFATEALERVGSSGHYILGKEVEQFESEIAAFWGLPHAVGVGNGMDAIEIALRALGCKVGDSVLTTFLSAFATTLAILRLGAKPVFVDTDSNGLIDLTLCEKAFEEHPEIRYFVPVHLYGFCLDLVTLRRLKEKYKLKIIEDCAQSIGARFEDAFAGSVGDAAVSSFYPTKNLGALGDGGIILVREFSIAQKARSIRNYGQAETYRHVELGMNSRLDELQASILRTAFLPKLDEWNRRRTQIASIYLNGIRNPRIRMADLKPQSAPVWHLFPVWVDPDHRNSLRAHLETMGIASGVHYPEIIPKQPVMKDPSIQFSVLGELTLSSLIVQSEVSLPIHPYLTEEEITQVIAVLNSWSPRKEIYQDANLGTAEMSK